MRFPTILIVAEITVAKMSDMAASHFLPCYCECTLIDVKLKKGNCTDT
jgi:hypothetical protein